MAEPIIQRSSEGARRSFQANRGRDTGPERRLRSAVHARGLRFRVSKRPLPELRRSADLLFTRARVAVFLDGCFWHGCPEHYTAPKANADFWSAKLRRNIERDRETDRVLTEAGWLVLRFWEHEDVDESADVVECAVRQRRCPHLPARQKSPP